MRLEEFIDIKSEGSRIILANRESYANSLLRKMNIQNGKDVLNVQPMTVSAIAKELLVAYHAMTDGLFCEIINSQEAVYVLDKVLHAKDYATILRSSLSIPTVKEIKKCIDEIRSNDLTDEYANCTDHKIVDLKDMVAGYEKELENTKTYDNIRILNEVISILEGNDPDSDPKTLLPWATNGAIFADLISNRWSDLERRFVKILSEKISNELYVIEDVLKSDEIKIDTSPLNIRFYRSYGMANEVEQIASLISEGNSIYGDIVVYYTNPVYLNFIKASFDERRIPYVRTNGYPATELSLTQLMLDLIASVKENFSFELFEKVALNSKLTYANVVGSDSVLANPISGYRAALSKGIGWGRDRYINYVNVILPEDRDYEEQKLFADMLIEHCKVFDKSKTVSEIFEGLWEFVGCYTRKNNPEKKYLSDPVWQQICDLKSFDDSKTSFEDKLSLIEDFLNCLTVSDDPDPAAVSVSAFNGVQVIERREVFFVGMSAGCFATDTRQSPILLDEEKKRFFVNAQTDSSSVCIAGAGNRIRRSDMIRTLAGISGGSVTFLYSDYDTIALQESSPSVMFLELVDALSLIEDDIKEAGGYRLYKEDMLVDSQKLRDVIKVYGEKKRKEVEALAKERKDKRTKEVGSDAQDGKKAQDGIRMSATGLQTFLSCPFMYYYAYVQYLKIYEQKRPSANEWLSAFSKGNLCHYSMEKYFGEKMPPNEFDGSVDETRLRQIVKECAEEIEKVEPFISKAVRQREEEHYFDLMLKYLENVALHWNDKHKWEVIGCEIRFGLEDDDPVEYTGSTSMTDHVRLLFNGSIDRMDGYLDENQMLHLRIVDYKTGKKESKEKEVKEGVQIQHILYGMAALSYLEKHKEEVKEQFNTTMISGYSFDWIGYEFPYEDEVNYSLNVTDVVKEIEGNILIGKVGKINIDFDLDTAEKMDRVIGAFQNGNISEIAFNCDEIIQKTIDDEQKKLLNDSRKKNKKYTLNDYCNGRYCDYRTVCRKWVGGIDK